MWKRIRGPRQHRTDNETDINIQHEQVVTNILYQFIIHSPLGKKNVLYTQQLEK